MPAQAAFSAARALASASRADSDRSTPTTVISESLQLQEAIADLDSVSDASDFLLLRSAAASNVGIWAQAKRSPFCCPWSGCGFSFSIRGRVFVAAVSEAIAETVR
jgi:hypothetical protein